MRIKSEIRMSKDEERVIRLRKKLDKNDLGNSKVHFRFFDFRAPANSIYLRRTNTYMSWNS